VTGRPAGQPADPQADRHDPDDKPIGFRLYDAELRAWLAAEPKRRGISRAALIIEALREKRARADHAAASDRA
jgi:hypothetical protein